VNVEHKKTNLKNMSPRRLAQFLEELGERPHRARQLGRWIYRHSLGDFSAMTDLPASLRERLSQVATIGRARLMRDQTARDGCRKFLFQFEDGATAETVLIPEGRRRTMCVSTQTGCSLGCRFCATGHAGPGRDLTSGEIVDQIMQAPVPRPTHVVIMGMGEPLLNLGQTLKALRLMTWPYGLGIGPRRVILSTIGIPDGIRDLTAAGLRIGLAISLNAATDDLRRGLMPAADSIADVLAAARLFARSAATRDSGVCALPWRKRHTPTNGVLGRMGTEHTVQDQCHPVQPR
jgi:23S rRNA (adenine2503-C2)-methyltransferase